MKPTIKHGNTGFLARRVTTYKYESGSGVLRCWEGDSCRVQGPLHIRGLDTQSVSSSVEILVFLSGILTPLFSTDATGNLVKFMHPSPHNI